MDLIVNHFGSSVYYDSTSVDDYPVHYSCDAELERYFNGQCENPPRSASTKSRSFVTGNNLHPEFHDSADDVEFDANHPDFINDYKIQSVYLKR